VWENGYVLHIDRAQISGKICNGFAGEIQYQNASTIRGSAVAFTEMWCDSTQGGPDIMEVEKLFQDGLIHGMAVSESGDTLVLRDVETGAAFVYAKPVSS
jgi:heat shock protein HslJ